MTLIHKHTISFGFNINPELRKVSQSSLRIGDDDRNNKKCTIYFSPGGGYINCRTLKI
jgi:hypothetical protein